MDTRAVLSTLLVGFLLLLGGTSLRAQELYYGDDDDSSPEEYYLEGIGYGEDYGSYSAEDSSYSGLYSPSADEAVYGDVAEYEPVIYDVDGDEAYALPADPGPAGGSDSMAASDAADWFSMAGVALLEVLGNDDLGRVLITRNAQGEFSILKEGEIQKGAFKVLGIGSEQARVEPAEGGGAKVVPVLHRPAPMDALLAGVARLQNLRVAIGKNLTREVNFDESMLDLEEGFAPLLATENVFLKRFDDVLVVRGAPFLAGGSAYEPTGDLPEGEQVELEGMRLAGAEVLDTLGKAFPEGTTGGPDKVPGEVSLLMGATPAAEALHYLNLAWATDYQAAAPKAPAKKEAPSRDRAARLYEQAVAFYKKGNVKEAGRRLLYLCKNGSKNPAHYQALGKVYWKMNRPAHAVRAWKAGLKVAPQNAKTRALLSRAIRKIKAARAGRSS